MFDDIRPYYDEEIPGAMRRIAADPLFPALASFVFPDMSVEEVRDMLVKIDNISDFQEKVMYEANLRIIKTSTTGLACEGVGHIDKNKNYVFVSNHRDIMLDASLLQNILHDNGLDTTEITFGANLMKGGLVIDIGKSNKMFKVDRPGEDMRTFFRSLKHISEYIRAAIVERGQSVWIAQRNGRTKDGIDRTDQGIINMFRLSGSRDMVRSIAELNILPVAVSYEWEPCDVAKALELYARRQGPYVKKEGEDLQSILTGILRPKGHVHFSICPPVTETDLLPFADLSTNAFNCQVAKLIDRRICRAYRLFPNNYIAHDVLLGNSDCSAHYKQSEYDAFVKHLAQLGFYAGKYDMPMLKSIFLGIYANPVDSAAQFCQS